MNNEGEPPAEGGWSYKPEGDSEAKTQMARTPGAIGVSDPDSVEWTATEFIVRQKSVSWYVVFVLIAVAITVCVYVFEHDLIATGAMAFVLITFGIAAGRAPHMVDYRLDRRGLTIGQSLRPYSGFKSFLFVQDDGQLTALTLLPTKRFAIPLTVYVGAADVQRVVESLSTHIPVQPGAEDWSTRFLRRIHF